MTKITIGDIVTLNSHPYFNNLTSILISGDSIQTPPLMIVTEIFVEHKNNYDEQTGDFKGVIQCKCVWYSTNHHQFEEVWISERMLKIIEKHKEVEESLETGMLISLKTLNLELKKQKSYLKSVGYDNKQSNISALLTFVPPVMQIVGKSRNECKDPMFDGKTGIQKRYISQDLIKCKWYNSFTEKFSEKLLPAEALQMINQVNEDILKEIQTSIKESTYCEFMYMEKKLLVQPKEISFRSGYYYLIAYDYFSNKIEEFEINFISKLEIIEKYWIEKFPNFNSNDRDFSPENIKELKLKILEKYIDKSYFLIVYKNRNNIFSTRTLKDCKIIGITIDEKAFEDDYLQAYCLSKKEIRYFKIERIQSIEVLNIN